MSDPQLLPPEIWLEVFRWATAPDESCNPSTPAYVPFQPTPSLDVSDPTATVKSVLPLVCREWNRLSTKFLYQDLSLPQGTHTLINVFDQGGDEGKWVRHCLCSLIFLFKKIMLHT
jgi:F-box-like